MTIGLQYATIILSMDEQNEYITVEKKVALEKELETLIRIKRKEVLEVLEFAKSLGDLSENAEYHQAREEQAKLEDRISKIESVLKLSTVVKGHHSTNVEVGSTITVQKEGDKEKNNERGNAEGGGEEERKDVRGKT